MSKSSKILVGILSITPIICLFVYLWSFFSFFTNTIELTGHKSYNPGAEAEMFFSNFRSLLLTIMLMCILSLGMLIYFIIHAVNNQHIDSNERLVWILVFIFAGIVGFPIYWILRIWQEPKPKPVSGFQAG